MCPVGHDVDVGSRTDDTFVVEVRDGLRHSVRGEIGVAVQAHDQFAGRPGPYRGVEGVSLPAVDFVVKASMTLSAIIDHLPRGDPAERCHQWTRRPPQ